MLYSINGRSVIVVINDDGVFKGVFESHESAEKYIAHRKLSGEDGLTSILTFIGM